MSDWTVFPAIDLRTGQVVRLLQGDPRQSTHYGDDPAAVALQWHSAGADWVHVVSLDGALDEDDAPNQLALQRILDTGLRVQFGGGLRDLQSIQRVLDCGVQRAVIGTAAIENPGLVRQAVRRFGADYIAVALDVRNGQVQAHGWRQGAGMLPADLAKSCAAWGLHWLIYTNVSRDGTGRGLDVEGAVELVRQTGLRVIASGGIRDQLDLQLAHSARLNGVIIGRALYEGHISLTSALQVGRVAAPADQGKEGAACWPNA
jgi:phosphoribosylformimino-5-aminoimidazole carboxamide ribotide isomerase